jgi:hypothetical protein
MKRVSTAAAAVMVIGLLSAPSAQAEQVNTPPVAVADSVPMVSGQTLRLDPRVNDTDADGDVLSIASAQVHAGAGSVSVEGAGPTQVLVIQAAAAMVGPLVIGYTVDDGHGGQASSTVTATVSAPAPPPNPDPPAEPPVQPPATPVTPAKPANARPLVVRDVLKVRAGSGRTKIAVLANDRDPDGDRIRLAKVYKAPKGTAKKSGARIAYRAPKKWTGKVRVVYKIRDSHGATDKGVLTVKVKKPLRPKPAPAPSSGTPSSGQVESALSRLGLPTGWVNGTYDQSTRRAVCAWRVVTGRTAHRGLPTAKEARAIVAMRRLPKAPSSMVTGVNVGVTCQAAFWVSASDTYRRVMPASTGMAGYRTRVGTWRVFITHHTWRYSTIYPEARMYKPMQFSGGQAMHGSATDALVKTYPASHGCVRMLHRDIDALQAAGVGNGSLVRVFGTWKG